MALTGLFRAIPAAPSPRKIGIVRYRTQTFSERDVQTVDTVHHVFLEDEADAAADPE
jgi:hypothetical protein